MSFVLSIDAERWRAHQASVVTAVKATGAGEIVPVIKGSGYSLGQSTLADEAARINVGTVAVGTVFELGEMLDLYSGEIIVLQPFEVRDLTAADAWHFLADRGHRVIRTISSTEALLALADGPGPVRVILEGRTSMQRFGFTHDELLAALADSRVRAALAEGRILLRGLALHMPIAQPADEISPRGAQSGTARVRETLRWAGSWAAELEHIGGPEAACLWVSHLDDSELGAVVRSCSTLSVRPRIGTRLWLDRRSLKASGTVLAVHPLPNGTHVGYRQRSGPRDGTLVVVSGGTSHGIGLSAPSPASSVRQRVVTAGTGALDAAGRAMSPFTCDGKQRWFAEAPHAQVSMIWLPRGAVIPSVGDQLGADVRFTTSHFDAIIGLS
jgi:alanine racemase